MLGEAYKDKKILLTGGTGFLGTALVEKILRSLPNIGCLYLVIRPSRGRSAAPGIPRSREPARGMQRRYKAAMEPRPLPEPDTDLAVPEPRLEVIPGAGHFPHWEQPDEFVRRLIAFAG